MTSTSDAPGGSRAPANQRSGVYVRLRRVPTTPTPLFPTPSLDDEDHVKDHVGDDGGLTADQGNGQPVPQLVPGFRLVAEELRVDVDGRAPTMTVSGVVPGATLQRALTWIARVAPTANGTYLGRITFRDGPSALLPQTRVEVALGTLPSGARTAMATFSGGGTSDVSFVYEFSRHHFREVNFEFDTVSDALAVTSYDTGSHPNRPAGLPAEVLSIESAFEAMGIHVVKSGGDSMINNTGAGANSQWSNVEMHDAMQVNWSRWRDAPQWAMWVLFARQHERGRELGGIMFDSIGVAQRQGTAIFSDSFVAEPPPGDPAPAEWVRRMRFWTAVHEIGHAFNLAHSWQKTAGVGWVPLSDEREARTYMNYPFKVLPAPGRTREQTFYANFEFRFSEQELLFMRHAPARLVQQGDAAWFDHHAFEEVRAAAVAAGSPLRLSVRVNRSRRFEFLEPVTVELKLKNTGTEPITVDRHVLDSDQLSVFAARDDRQTRLVRRYARSCYAPEETVLRPGESLYASAYLSSDATGIVVAEPGDYTVYATVAFDYNDVLAAPLRLRVAPPLTRDEERLASDLLQPDVGRVLAFGGSRVLDSANAVLHQAVERLPDRRVALHAEAALGAAVASPGKIVEWADDGARVRVREGDAEAGVELLRAAYRDLDTAAETFGHIGLRDNVLSFAATLSDQGERHQAGEVVNELASTLRDRGVKPAIVADTQQQAADLLT